MTDKVKETNEELKLIQEKLRSVLSDTNLNNIDPNSDFDGLVDGYYLSELQEANVKFSQSSGKLQVVLKFKTIEEGKSLKVDEDGNTSLINCGCKNRLVWKYFSVETPENVRKFAKEMLKFEDDNMEPILSTEYFTTPELLYDALDVLVGMRIYIQISTTTNDKNETSSWTNIISWKRAASLELITEDK